MTSRRSIQTWPARVSQQQQFRPGHTSGRVASAQPITRNILKPLEISEVTLRPPPLPPIDTPQWLLAMWEDEYADLPPSSPWYPFLHRPYQYIPGTYYWDTEFANIPDQDLLTDGTIYGGVTLQLLLPDTIPDGGDVVFQVVLLTHDPPVPATPGDLEYYVRTTYTFPGPHTPGSLATLGPMSFEYMGAPFLAMSSTARMQAWVDAWLASPLYYDSGYPILGWLPGLDGSP